MFFCIRIHKGLACFFIRNINLTKKKGDREILKKRIYVDVVILLNRN